MFVLYFALWILFNGSVTPQILGVGILIAGAVFAFVCKFADYSLESERQFYRSIPAFLRFFAVLIREIIVANLIAAKMILTRKESELQPLLVSFPGRLKGEVQRTLLANSITLTPGTITVFMDEERYVIHCLDESLADGLEESIFSQVIDDIEFSIREREEEDHVDG